MLVSELENSETAMKSSSLCVWSVVHYDIYIYIYLLLFLCQLTLIAFLNLHFSIPNDPLFSDYLVNLEVCSWRTILHTVMPCKHKPTSGKSKRSTFAKLNKKSVLIVIHCFYSIVSAQTHTPCSLIRFHAAA